ncbi:hypothetical protein [Aquimarina rhabdastrellae]
MKTTITQNIVKKRKGFYVKSSMILAGLMLTSSCYTYKWGESKNDLTAAPTAIQKIFEENNNTIVVNGVSPSETYEYDAWEKDETFAKDEEALHFNTVEMTLNEHMPEGQVQIDFKFKDKKGNEVVVEDFDVMRIIPTLNTEGDHLYPELLLEEFNRYGVGFRKEFKEFSINKSQQNSEAYNKALDRTYRMSIVNGCLDPGKWEVSLTSEDYSDFNERVHNPVNFNQNKILAHTWFLLPKELYRTLVQEKNRGINVADFDYGNFDYKTLSNRSKEVTIDFEKLRRPIKRRWKTEMIEVGHKSNRAIELLDMEEHYKIDYGLFVNYDTASLAQETYNSIIQPEKQPLKFAQFRDEGFYSPKTALSFDMNWLSHLDEVIIESVDLPETDCLVQIQLTGKWSPFTVTLGNFDLSTVQEQKLYGLHFGFNVYPKGRRYNPVQPTITFDEDLMPKTYERYVLLTDTKTNKWVDNFHKGLGKVYLSFNTLEKDVLDIYLISYERIAPLWMASVRLPKELREKARIRKQLYNY